MYTYQLSKFIYIKNLYTTIYIFIALTCDRKLTLFSIFAANKKKNI